MKKFFLFAAAVATALTINAQEKVVKEITDYANYIEFQALMADPAIKGATINSENPLELPNGAVINGYKKADESEAECKWNAKEDYNTTWWIADGLDGVDSLTVGTQLRAGSGCSIAFGDFETSAAGKVYVYYQLNGDDSSKQGENVRGVSLTIGSADPVEYRFATAKNCCVAKFDLPAGKYEAGDLVLKVLKNTINIAGIRIDNMGAKAVNNVNAAVKAEKFYRNGQLVIRRNGVEFNALGVKF